MKHETDSKTVLHPQDAASTYAPSEPMSVLQFKQQLAGMSYEEQVRAIQPDLPVQLNKAVQLSPDERRPRRPSPSDTAAEAGQNTGSGVEESAEDVAAGQAAARNEQLTEQVSDHEESGEARRLIYEKTLEFIFGVFGWATAFGQWRDDNWSDFIYQTSPFTDLLTWTPQHHSSAMANAGFAIGTVGTFAGLIPIAGPLISVGSWAVGGILAGLGEEGAKVQAIEVQRHAIEQALRIFQEQAGDTSAQVAGVVAEARTMCDQFTPESLSTLSDATATVARLDQAISDLPTVDRADRSLAQQMGVAWLQQTAGSPDCPSWLIDNYDGGPTWEAARDDLIDPDERDSLGETELFLEQSSLYLRMAGLDPGSVIASLRQRCEQIRSRIPDWGANAYLQTLRLQRYVSTITNTCEEESWELPAQVVDEERYRAFIEEHEYRMVGGVQVPDRGPYFRPTLKENGEAVYLARFSIPGVTVEVED